MSEMHSGPEMRFLCDQNLGRLVKWLRILGFDAVYLAFWDDARIRGAIAEGRAVLTRKKAMAAKSGMVYIGEDKVEAQVREVSRVFDLGRTARPFTRCTLCNSVLVGVTRGEAKGRVPEYVYTTQEVFAECPDCRRIYWRGTHFQHAGDVIASLLGQ
ncbi:MAG: Mut7-C RNAse domain-containing protein [Deltaproteobacteria bacterium]|nr:Mut7-C RNAse domain-containing protein [Deltaproteobacteria bacterium]